jgi:hypothetical protein
MLRILQTPGIKGFSQNQMKEPESTHHQYTTILSSEELQLERQLRAEVYDFISYFASRRI